MHGEVLAIHDCRQGHVIETLHEQVVNLLIISADALLSEGEVLSHVSTLVITSQKHNVFRVILLQTGIT